MKKIVALIAGTMLVSQITACGNAQLPMAAAPGTVQVGAQSILGINKEITKSVEANFKAKDKDADGFIIPAEFPVQTPEDYNSFRQLDSNKDGKLSKGELTPSIVGRAMDILQLKATAAFLYDELDGDNNGQLSRAEVEKCKIPGVAASYDAYLGKSFFGKQLTYLRRSDFENLVAFALLGPGGTGRNNATPGK